MSEDERGNLIALYDGEINYTDDIFIKPLIRKLKDLGLYDKTLIIFTSDHGEEFYEHKGWGHGINHYNEQIRVPLIIKFPGEKYRGKKIKARVGLIDIVPTILDVAGIDHSAIKMDGISLVNLIKGKKLEDRILHGSRFIYISKPGQSFDSHLINFYAISNIWKLILNNPYPPRHPKYYVTQGPPFAVDKEEFFNNEKDPGDFNNLAAQSTRIQHEIQKKMLTYYKEAREAAKINQVGQAIDQKLEEKLKALGYIK